MRNGRCLIASARRGLGAALALAALSGCVSMKTPMTSFSLDYNRMVADSRNQMVLLNIVRASNREPMHFTAISQVEGSLSIGGSAGGDLDFANGNPNGPQLSVNGSYSPTFTIVPLNTADFSTGILKPIRPDIVRLFLSQGWRPALLAPLMIESVTCPDGTVVPNDPRQEDMTAFSEIEVRDGKEPKPPTEARARPGKPQEFEEPLKGRFELELSSDTAASLLQSDFDSKFTITQTALADGKARLSLYRGVRGETEIVPGARLTERCHIPASAQKPEEGEKPAIRYNLRSVEGVLYYLGELARTGQAFRIALPPAPGSPCPVENGRRQVTLFDIRHGYARDDAVRVSHRGQRYALALSPNGCDRSMDVIGLVNSLIALQTSSDDLTRFTGSVRIR